MTIFIIIWMYCVGCVTTAGALKTTPLDAKGMESVFLTVLFLWPIAIPIAALVGWWPRKTDR